MSNHSIAVREAPAIHVTARRPPARELLGLCVILAVFVAIAGPFLLADAPLGHDESVYAQRSRSFADDHVAGGYWQDYRAPGLPALMSVAHRFVDGDGMLRTIPFVLALLLICFTWLWTRKIHGPAPALLAALMLALTPGFATWAWQIGVDIPGAAIGSLAILVFTFASAGERVKPWGLAAVPLAMAATYVRFGAPVFVGAGMAAVAITHHRAVRRSPAITTAIAIGSLASMYAVLKIPFLTGSTTAPADAFAARQTAKGIPFSTTLAELWEVAPRALGPAVGLAVAMGVAAGGLLIARRRSERIPVLATIAAFVMFTLGLTYGVAQAFVQYVLPGLPFLFSTAAAGLAWFLRRIPRSLTALLLVAVVAIAIPYARSAASNAADRLAGSYDDIRAAAIAVRERHEDRACLVLTSYTPSAGWYTRCAIVPFPLALYDPSVDRARVGEILDADLQPYLDRLPSAAIYALYVNGGKRQPSPEVIQAIRELAQQPSVVVKGSQGRRGSVIVDLLADPQDPRGADLE